jgi:succinate-semialdehyde dehydrogenase/glutarate-semialdehyde dehydrogenase
MQRSDSLYIDGKWGAASNGATFTVINPATEEPLGQMASATEQDVDAAIAAARKGFEIWRKVQPWERARLIRRVGDLLREREGDIAKALTLEVGKPLAQAKGEAQSAAEQFEWFAEETKRIYGQTVESRAANGRMIIDYQPVGVVAAFAAWNFPAVLAARKIAPALAAGCSIICRPAGEAPSSVALIVQCCHDAGLPPGVVNLLTGDINVISPRIMASPVVRKVTLTGSVPVGKRVLKAAADTMKRVTMELGGHAPVIVFDDADIDHAADMTAQSKFRNAGQVCVSPTRFYIHESSIDRFASRFVEVTRKLKLGDGMTPGVDVGPLTTKRRLEAVEELVADTRARGAELLHGGKRPAGFNRGFFYAPTVFRNVPDDARVMNEEPFGPIAPITTFRDFDEVMRRANALKVGLGGYVFTRSLKRAHEASEAMETGMVGVNTLALASAEAPFGGVKESGFGREGGSLGIKDYLDVKYTNMVLM